MSDLPPTPDSSLHRLALLLRDHKEALIHAWARRVLDDPSAPEADRLRAPALRDHVPGLLDWLSERLDTCALSPERAERLGRSLGDGATWREHAEHLFGAGYTLAAVLGEISRLRAAIVALCAQEGVPLGGPGAALVHGALDEASAALAVAMDRAALAVEVTEQVRARTAAEAAHERLALLVQISAVMGSSLDYESRLKDLARLLVPVLGEGSTVSVVGPGGAIQRLTDAAVNDEIGARVERARSMPVPEGLLPIIRGLLEGGRARHFADYTAEVIAGLPPEEPYVKAARAVAAKATIFAPLCLRGRAVGYLTVFRVSSGDDYTPEDVALVEAIAERAALAIENARLFDEVRRSEERFRVTFEQAAVGVAHVGLDGRWQRVNQKLAAILGYTPEELRARTFRDITYPDDMATSLADFERLIAGEIGSSTMEKRYLRKDGALVWVNLASSLVRRASGEPDHLIAVVADISPRKAAEAERALFQEMAERLLAREKQARAAAEEANALKDQFLATVSHELRTPLNAMLGWTRMLRAGQIPPERRERALETVERNARAQAQLVEDLLDISRIMSGKLRIDVHPIDLVGVVEAALETVRPAADAKQIRLVLSLGPGAIPILGDAARLQQVIWNLLSNAIKFTPKGGQVQIQIERLGSSIEIAVKDTGQGIAPGFLPHVFERFRQAEGGTTRVHGGLGLGLSIVKNLVELHGGTVRALSEGEGTGATFITRLPLAPTRDRAAESRATQRLDVGEAECPPQIRGLRIVVVEDEPDARELLVALLERCGAMITAAESVGEALDALERVRPELIVADIAMPGEDGYALIRKIRALPPEDGGRTPVVALTAYARSEDRTRALRAGFNMHVPKPIDAAELLAVIASLAPQGAMVP